MAQYSLFVLKVPLDTNKKKQTKADSSGDDCVRWWSWSWSAATTLFVWFFKCAHRVENRCGITRVCINAYVIVNDKSKTIAAGVTKFCTHNGLQEFWSGIDFFGSKRLKVKLVPEKCPAAIFPSFLQW